MAWTGLSRWHSEQSITELVERNVIYVAERRKGHGPWRSLPLYLPCGLIEQTVAEYRSDA